MVHSSNGQPADLEELARTQFGPLSDAETKLVVTAPKGETAYCGPSDRDDDPNNEPANSEDWGPERAIRAELIRWLCVDRDAKDRVDPRGIRAHGAVIAGQLDLSVIAVPFFLGLIRCSLSDHLDLSFIEIPSIDLTGTCLPSLKAEHATVRGTVSLGGLRSKGAIQLRGVHIGGNLICDRAKFQNPAKEGAITSGIALEASNAKVSGAVLLRHGFAAEGQVRLYAAEIGGNLACEGGTFRNPALENVANSGVALNAEGAKVSGAVLLRKGFAADGEARLYAAEIGGNLDCAGGKFQNPAKENIANSGIALNAEGARVSGAVLLRKGFVADGEARLYAAEIKGNLDCGGGKFQNQALENVANSGIALNADGARVSGAVLLRSGFVAEGQSRLYAAEIGVILSCEGGRFQNPAKAGVVGTGIALEAANAKVSGAVLLRNGFAAAGQVRLFGAEVGGNLECDSAKFQNPVQAGVAESGTALNAEGAKVTRSFFLRNGFTAEGQVRLYGAQIGGTLSCDGGTFQNPAKAGIAGSGIALEARNAKVAGDVLLQNGFTAEGQVRLYSAEIGGALVGDRGKFQNPAKAGIVGSGIALDAPSIKARNVLLQNGFTAEGQVRLHSAEIGGTLGCDGGKFQNSAQADVAESGTALNAEGAKVSRAVLLRYGFAAEGQVRLYGAEIGGSLECDGGKFQNPAKKDVANTGMALNAEGAKVGRSVLLRDGFAAEGQVWLYGAEIGGSLECDGGKFQNPAKKNVANTGTALNAEGAKVGRAVLLRDGFAAEGQVWLYGAQIGGNLNYRSSTFESLNLGNVSAGAIVDDEQSWPKAGKLFLDGFVYGRISSGPVAAAERLAWLARQASFTRHPYRQLAKVLKDAGDDRGWRRVGAEMEKKTWERRSWIVRPFSYLLWGTIGYGYFSLRALWWLLALVILGAVVYWRGYQAGSIVPTNKDAYDTFVACKRLPGNYEAFHPLPYSLENSFPLIKFGVQDKWAPGPDAQGNTRRPTGSISRLLLATCSPGFVRWFRWLQICAGWILATLFVGGVTGVIRRD